MFYRSAGSQPQSVPACREFSMRLTQYLLAGCIACLSLPGQAETVNNLYQVREPVSGQTPDERTTATAKALETLVLRLTGDPKAVTSPGLASAFKDPQQIITQFGYDAGPPLSLQVDFDPVSVDNRLRQAGLPTWGSNRPSILGWWLNDTVDGANLIGDGQPSAEPLRHAAQHRGLPLRLPLADLNEQIVGTAKNLEGSDAAPLRAASERYGADALLAVHAHQDGDKWQAKWRLWLGDKPENGTAEGTDQATLADAVLLAVSQRLAPRYLAKPGATSEMTLQVQGNTLERYAQLGRLLEPFGARLKQVQGDSVTYRLTGSADQLRAQLTLAKLQETPVQAAPIVASAVPQPGMPVTPAVPAAAPAADLIFHW
jgi:hypothetical protein